MLHESIAIGLCAPRRKGTILRVDWSDCVVLRDVDILTFKIYGWHAETRISVVDVNLIENKCHVQSTRAHAEKTTVVTIKYQCDWNNINIIKSLAGLRQCSSLSVSSCHRAWPTWICSPCTSIHWLSVNDFFAQNHDSSTSSCNRWRTSLKRLSGVS